jgi:hypothetical protein
MAGEPFLPDAALVVRGGRITAESLVRGCARHEGVFGCSVQGAPDLSFEQLAAEGGLPHKAVGVTSVGAIRAQGYNGVPTRGKGKHATLVLPEDIQPEAADRLARLFDPRPNPHTKV